MGAAAERFRAACEAEPKLALAHYRLAAVTFRALQDDGCGGISSSTLEAGEHLATALQLDKKLVRALKDDPDFAAFRGTARYHALLGANLASLSGLEAVLAKIKLRPPITSDMGPAFFLQLRPGGVAEVKARASGEDGPRWVDLRGTWRLRERRVDGRREKVLSVAFAGGAGVAPIRYSGVVTVGPEWLVLENPEGRFFASDEWAECCC